MSNMIERQDAIDAIYETFCYAYCDNCEKEMNEDLCGDCHRKYQNWSASKKTIEKVINNLPSAQPEITKGKWLVTEAWPHRVYCSCCYKTFVLEHWEIWKDGSLSRNFCPNCGAEMKGETE